MLLDPVPDSSLQHELDLENDDCADRSQLMIAVDPIHGRYGVGTVYAASTGAIKHRLDGSMLIQGLEWDEDHLRQ